MSRTAPLTHHRATTGDAAAGFSSGAESDRSMDAVQLIAQGRTAVQRGDYDSARASFEEVLRIAPQSDIALGGLGHCLARLGRVREARERLLEAARLLQRPARKSGNVDPLLDLAHELHGLLAFESSVAVIDAALKIRPAAARGHHLRAQALARMNRHEEARVSALRARTLAPHASNAAILLATIDIELGKLDEARALLETVVGRPGDPDLGRALFELGRVLDRQGDAPRAFESISRAGRLALSRLPAGRFDENAVPSRLALERTLCTARFVEETADEGEARSPVFMIGFYRSGTTLLEQVLDAHPQVSTSDEHDIVPRVIRHLGRQAESPGEHWTRTFRAVGPVGRQKLRALYWTLAEDRVGRALEPSERFVDKTAMNTLHAGFIRALFPRAPVVFCLRDPRDVLLSCFMQAFTPDPLTAHFLDWTAAARFYDAVMSHWEHMRGELGIACVEIRYEDVVRDLRQAVAPVLSRMGLEWQDAQASFHEHARGKVISTPSFADVSRPLYRSAEGRWRRYAKEFDGIAQWLDPHAIRYGYGALARVE
ncbi:MAG: sulfotransferase [Betaproteobacteria bacterium]|nr:sulfotransferase [Betaproteobacteria bacterium]